MYMKMEKQIKILFITLFSVGLFFAKFFYVYAVYPDPILDENLYPKITSVSSTVVRPANIVRNRDTVEIFGENFNNGKKEVNDPWFFPIGNSYGYVDIISWTDSKIVVTFVPGYDKGENAKFRIYYVDKYGDTVYAESQPFTIKEFCHTAYDDWTCSDYGLCQEDGTQTRICVRSDDCQELTNPMPKTMQSCYYAPFCTDDNWSCTNWSTCNLLYHTQTRTCTKNPDCQGGVSKPTTQSCVYIPSCYSSDWSCSSWNTCSSSGSQTRTCNKNSNCEGGTSSPATTQSCTYAPTCTEDTWSCGSWGTCSPSGVQTRSCTKTFDCSNAQTASPVASQYCTPPGLGQYQISPADQEVVNQDNIVKATVNLWCPLNDEWYQVGSGTVIDSDGTILTNKHVIDGTPGCLVGFINSYQDEPYFSDRQIADIVRVSYSIDAAILKLRNPSNTNLTYVNALSGNSSSLTLGDSISTYGYPTAFGSKITSTKGEFNGVEGDFLKTSAIIDKGNSGGGAYLSNGTYIGIPTKVFPGTFNNLGGILSINTIKSWYNGTPVAYDPSSNNNYSRVSSVLENVDLQKLGSYNLYVGDNFAADTKTTPEYILDSSQYTGTRPNLLNLRTNWLVKNREFVEVFWVDSDLCLHWIINEKIAEKNFGHTWNYEGNIQEFNTMSEYGYEFCDKLD